MPSLRSSYTLADFMLRLERSPVTHMSPLYHENRQLFQHRPDVFDRVVLSVSWQKGLALVDAAYYAQRVEVGTYRALLARMLLHNQHAARLGAVGADGGGAAACVDWRAALRVYTEALTAHGLAVPSRLAVSTLRLLAPHAQATGAARALLRSAEVNGRLTRPMLVDGAACCAAGGEWEEALRLLRALHREDPALLTGAIESLRPHGTDALTAAATADGAEGSSPPLLFPGGGTQPQRPTPAQRHVLRVLNLVVAAVPGEVALTDELCFSYLTHLTASTTLTAEERARALGTALARLALPETVRLLQAYTEPNLLREEEWRRLRTALPHPPPLLALTGDGAAARGGTRTSARRSLRRAARRRARQARGVAGETGETGEAAGALCEAADEAPPLTVVDGCAPPALAAHVLRTQLRLGQCAPSTAAAFVAVLVAKMPTAEDAWELAVHAAAAPRASEPEGLNEARLWLDALSTPTTTSTTSTDATLAHPRDALDQVVAHARQLHPVVRRALLRRCAADSTESGASRAWAVAAGVLLAQGSAHGPTPAGVLGPILNQLRAARQVSLVVRVLLEHMVPTRSTVHPEALEAVLECVLAHNRAAHRRWQTAAAARLQAAREAADGAPLPALEDPSVVHWRSAMSWAGDLQVALSEERVVRTGTGPSVGAVARHPAEALRSARPLSPRLLSLVVHICVDAGSPRGALEAMGLARSIDKTELALSAEVRAVLHCVLYNRPYEAEAIVWHAQERHGDGATAPLQRLLELAQGAKQREELRAALAEAAIDEEDVD